MGADNPGHDDDFLLWVFDHAVERLEDGLAASVDELLDGREHLRAQVEERVRLAQRIAFGQPRSLPKLAGYTLLGELGRGGMGTVFLARQEKLGGRPVALKILPPSVSLSARARERFAAEANAIAKLRHPNIVAIYDVIHEAGVHAYAMEWVEGLSLAQVIDEQRNQGGLLVRESFLEPIQGESLPPIHECRIGIRRRVGPRRDSRSSSALMVPQSLGPSIPPA